MANLLADPTMPLLRLHDCPARPWKNGLGRTRELAAAPEGAGMDDFLWRVSVAEVDSAAPFSRFPGIERTIVLIEGDGFHMHLDGSDSHALTEPFVPFAFAGEAEVSVTLAGGPTRDFNLMVRRAQATGQVDIWRQPADGQWSAHTVLLFCARGRLQIDDVLLEPGDAWRPSSAAPMAMKLAEGSVVLAVRVEARVA